MVRAVFCDEPGAMRVMMPAIRELGLDLLALLWPTACLGCGAADRDCCDACLAEVRAPPTLVERDIGLPCFAAGVYDGPVRAMLVLYKHAGRARFARELAPRLSAPLRAALAQCRGPGAPLVVAVPSRRAQVRRRGYRHVELLIARALRRGAPGERAANGLRGRRIAAMRLPALRALPGRIAQVGLASRERERNARRVAVKRSCEKLLRGREVVLVDDIVTTGATLRAAAERLEIAGARVVAAAVVCAVPRHDDRGGGLGVSSADAEQVEPAAPHAVEFDQRRNGAPHWPTRLSHLGGHYGREHPRQERRDHRSV
ncbi:ComF family protein [Leucobacter sp. GX0328]